MKRIITIIISVFILLYSLSAFAANPASIGASDGGNAWDLIVVKKPESKNSATLKKTYGITGTGRSGVQVAYYRFDGAEYQAIKSESGNIAQTTIGTAGIFYKQVSLSEGHNKFAVRAQAPDGAYQVVYFDINVLNQEIMNNINVFSNGIQTLYNGWMN